MNHHPIFKILALLVLFILLALLSQLITIGLLTIPFFSEFLEAGQLRLKLVLMQLLSYGLSAFLFFKLFYKDTWKNYLVNRYFNAFELVVAFTLVLCSGPIMQLLHYCNNQLPFVASDALANAQIEEHLQILIADPHPYALYLNLFAMALVPAVAEELFFRGAIQKILLDAYNKPIWAILLTALIFSTLHFQFDGFLVRFALGLILGYLFYVYKNILIPISTHFFINASQIYLQNSSIKEISQQEMQLNEWYYYLISLILTFFVVRFVMKKQIGNENS